LQILDGAAFAFSGVSRITLEEENQNFRVSGDFLMDFEGVTAVRYFVTDRNPVLSCRIENLGLGRFCGRSLISSLSFECGSKLRRIEAEALSYCSGLKSICIPASVEILCAKCFSKCQLLSSLTFEPESKLRQIENLVFFDCRGLTSLYIPVSVESIHGLAFARSGISMITIDEGNANFQFFEGVLMNSTRASVVRYFGPNNDVVEQRD
jgi:hypothetical protein